MGLGLCRWDVPVVLKTETSKIGVVLLGKRPLRQDSVGAMEQGDPEPSNGHPLARCCELSQKETALTRQHHSWARRCPRATLQLWGGLREPCVALNGGQEPVATPVLGRVVLTPDLSGLQLPERKAQKCTHHPMFLSKVFICSPPPPPGFCCSRLLEGCKESATNSR